MSYELYGYCTDKIDALATGTFAEIGTRRAGAGCR